MELDLRGRPEAGEEAPGGAGKRHDAASYGGLPPGVLPPELLWIRAAAYGVDLLLLAGGPLLLSTLVVVVVLLHTADPPPSLGTGFYAAQGLSALLFLLRDTGGGSPGKRLFGLRLVREGGRPVGVLASFIRNLPMLVPGWNLFELLSVIRREGGRRGGDRMAGTTLVES
ncbi:MAG TPA: RDD family protein [Thermoanaerobaculia bacterium]|nr:RDD family protein [Thermoanaerobaculia bacterium]HQR68466.1 RDD family protein [Thermoanaerobaculia bacterium]